MSHRLSQLKRIRELLAGSRITVAGDRESLPPSGLVVVPARLGRTHRLYFRQVLISDLFELGNDEWGITGTTREFPSLPAACFAAAARHLSTGESLRRPTSS